MKKLIFFVFFLGLNLQFFAQADDIKEFEIEGMSIGDSALNFIKKDYLLAHKQDWFQSNEFSVAAEMDLNFLNIYDTLPVSYTHLTLPTKA